MKVLLLLLSLNNVDAVKCAVDVSYKNESCQTYCKNVDAVKSVDVLAICEDDRVHGDIE